MSKFFRKLKQHTAQQVSEYSLVFILIGLGVIIMGPYVIRSWNAHLKMWEDSVTDSYRDPIKHEAEPDVPLPLD